MVPSSPAVAARKGRWFLMATALIALVWPAISPAEEPVSNWNTWPNLRTKVYYTLNQLPKKESYLSRPSPTAMILLLSPSHDKSLLKERKENRWDSKKCLKRQRRRTFFRWAPWTRTSRSGLFQRYPISLLKYFPCYEYTKKKSNFKAYHSLEHQPKQHSSLRAKNVRP